MSPEFGDWIRFEKENERLRTDLAAAARYEVERNHYRSENSRLLADLAAEREQREKQADVHTQIQMQFCRERDAALAALQQADEALWQLLDDMRDGLCVCHAAKEQAQEALDAIDAVLGVGNE